MKKAVLTLTLTSVVLTGGLAAAQQMGGILRAGMQTDPVNLDPHVTQATSTRNQLENVYDTLVMFDNQGRIVPALATRWTTSTDGRTWTFTLRSGVRFHNGRALTADDVAFSLNRIKDPETKSPRANDFSVVQSVTATNATTVTMRLARPYAPLLSKLAFSLNVIVPKEAVAQLAQRPVGTGPFTFVEYVPQTRMVLRKNPNFWGRDAQGRQLPYLDGITYSYLPDATARVTALRAGTVDWIEYVPATDVKSLQGNDQVSVFGGPSANYRGLFFNTKVKPFDDYRVRRAIAYAINTQEIVDVALLGAGGVAARGTTIPAGNFYALPDPNYGRPNLERARELLRQAGYPNGFTMNLKVTSTYDFLRTPAEIIQAQLAPLGIRVNITAVEWSVYLPDVLAKKYDVTILGESGQGDPDDYLYGPFKSDSGGNLTNFSDRTVDDFLERARAAASPQERKRLYDLAQRRILELSPMVFLYTSAQYEAARKNVQGFNHFLNTSYLGLRTTWLQR